MLVRIAIREDPDQTASSRKQSDLGMHCFFRFLAGYHMTGTFMIKLFTGDKVACMINNLGGMSVLEMNIIAKETLEYLGKSECWAYYTQDSS